jgi:hypothetical protein
MPQRIRPPVREGLSGTILAIEMALPRTMIPGARPRRSGWRIPGGRALHVVSGVQGPQVPHCVDRLPASQSEHDSTRSVSSCSAPGRGVRFKMKVQRYKQRWARRGSGATVK